MFYILWAITVAGAVLYQGAMKKVGASSNAFLLLLGAYLLAATISLIAYFAVPALFGTGPGISRAAPSPSWKLIAAVACGIFMIELGNALALGSNDVDLSLFVPLVWVSVIVGVTILGKMMFGESISTLKAAGIALCVAGIFLIKFAK
jgi:multidrug transporter EmrE-like cation transporter